MTQNRSPAVMAQRIEPPDSLDFFPTPPWATRALIEHVLIGRPWSRSSLRDQTCWEPACGHGHMWRPLTEYFRLVAASDAFSYGIEPDTDGFPFVYDFLTMGCSPIVGVDWIISNPPFRLGKEFILRAIDVAAKGVAMLVRTSFLESIDRYSNIFKPRPPSIVAPFVERVPMVKGRLDRAASSATSYTWLVWISSWNIPYDRDPIVLWIPPCRAQLERDSDYEVVS